MLISTHGPVAGLDVSFGHGNWLYSNTRWRLHLGKRSCYGLPKTNNGLMLSILDVE